MSFNQPRFSPCATWNPNGTTIADVNLTGITPHDVFVDTQNAVYVTDSANGRVQIWLDTSLPLTLSGNMINPHSIFVASNGDIYVDNGATNYRIDKWTFQANSSVAAVDISGPSYGLFIDIEDNLYWSLDPTHQVFKRPLNSDVNALVVAGIGLPGNASDMLYNPRGIFVDTDFNLYVADCNNNRIQLFLSGQLNGTTVAIVGSDGTFTLTCPTEVVLDGEDYLFVVDSHNHRILGSGPNGFRCIVGCTGINGSAADELSRPHSFNFDSYGNLFVIEFENNRLQKFSLSSNSCGKLR